MINSFVNLKLEGIWEITDVYPEKNNHRLGRYVVFPFELMKEMLAIWFYVQYDGAEKKGGCMCRTSTITNLQLNLSGDLQISTMNSQYCFKRVM